MSRLLNLRNAKLMSTGVDISFLLIHITLMLVFRKLGVMPMFYFNIGSVLFYTLMLFAINETKLKFFCVATYLEIVLHMCTAAWFVGWECDFQVTLIGISILSAYSEYAGKYLKVPYLKATPLNLVGMTCYIVTCVAAHLHTAPYPLPENVVFWFRLSWGIITLSITIFYLYTFVELSTRTEEILFREVDHDQLTGLWNRHGLWDSLNELDRKQQLEGHWACMMDIDDFKTFNDTYGHNCGDFILREIAELLREHAAPAQPCRWGGEEFLLFGETLGDYEARKRDIEELRRTIEEHVFCHEGREFHVTVTFGLAEYSSGDSIRDWIGAADMKLYEGKRSGKNCVVA